MLRIHCQRSLAATGFLLWVSACGKSDGAIALNRSETEPVPEVPVPAADGPKLAAIAHATPVRRTPNKLAKVIGYLHAGGKVARSEQPFSTEGCDGGWYPVRPRGFVCLEEGGTLDMRHPTLATMAIQPQMEAAAPYTYARIKKNGDLFEVDSDREQAVRKVGSISSQSGIAVVGSWEAADEDGSTRRLAMLTNGRFVDTTLLDKASVSEFQGVTLDEKTQLPVGFVVKRGVAAWSLEGAAPERKEELNFHQTLPLTGRFRTLSDEKYWELSGERWVRHRDVTAIAARDAFPEFVTGEQRWVDVSVVMGTAVAYEGKRPVYATLVSVGKDRLGEEIPDPVITQRGEFRIVGKHITALNANVNGFANRVEIYDAPWTLELASGQFLHGAYWHNRFGIEHGPGNVQLSPADARWIWLWSTPEVPEGWHAVVDIPETEALIVNVRK
jgi:hypothetical protein